MKDIIDFVINNDLYGVGECVEIAKGKYKEPTTIKEGLKKIKRIWRSRKLLK